MLDDAELLHRYVNDHSDAAFAEIVQRHIAFVYATALRHLNGATHRAEDVTQSVFIDLARKAGALLRRRDLIGWLHTSTHYAAAKLKRAEERRARRERAAATDMSLERETNWNDLRPVIDSAMHALNGSDRAAILMRFFQARSLRELGECTGVSADAARMRVERALDKLRAELARRGITSTTAALSLMLSNQPAVALPASFAATVTGAALASLTGGGFSAAVLLIMKTKSVLTGVAALAIGFAAYEFHQTRIARAEIAALVGERETLDARWRESERRAAAASQRGAELQAQVDAARPLKNAAAFAMPKNQNATPADPAPGLWSFRTVTPEQARALNLQNIDATYGALYRQLDWTAAQKEQFRNMMLDRQASGERLFKTAIAAARAKEPALGRAEMYEVFEATNAQTHLEQQADVRRFISESAAQALKQYQATLPMRGIANQLATALFNSANPLTPVQADQVVDILAQYARGPVGKVEAIALNPDAAAAHLEAEGVLNAPQLAELRQVMTRVQEQSKAERERMLAPVNPSN